MYISVGVYSLDCKKYDSIFDTFQMFLVNIYIFKSLAQADEAELESNK